MTEPVVEGEAGRDERDRIAQAVVHDLAHVVLGESGRRMQSAPAPPSPSSRWMRGRISVGISAARMGPPSGQGEYEGSEG